MVTVNVPVFFEARPGRMREKARIFVSVPLELDIPVLGTSDAPVALDVEYDGDWHRERKVYHGYKDRLYLPSHYLKANTEGDFEFSFRWVSGEGLALLKDDPLSRYVSTLNSPLLSLRNIDKTYRICRPASISDSLFGALAGGYIPEPISSLRFSDDEWVAFQASIREQTQLFEAISQGAIIVGEHFMLPAPEPVLCVYPGSGENLFSRFLSDFNPTAYPGNGRGPVAVMSLKEASCLGRIVEEELAVPLDRNPIVIHTLDEAYLSRDTASDSLVSMATILLSNFLDNFRRNSAASDPGAALKKMPASSFSLFKSLEAAVLQEDHAAIESWISRIVFDSGDGILFTENPLNSYLSDVAPYYGRMIDRWSNREISVATDNAFRPG